MPFKTLYTLTLTSLLLSTNLLADTPQEPLSVLIIGGGPAGLATAIEAKESGANVTLIEKRTAYSRIQRLFLSDSSIQLLQKWQVAAPKMQIAELEDGSHIGFVNINHLEESLESRAQELGVQKISGKFQAFKADRIAVILTAEQQQLDIPYDIVVGADGARSCVKEALAIKTHCLAKAMGAFAFILDPTDTSQEMEISPAIKKDAGFLRRIKAPRVSLLLMQSPINSSRACRQFRFRRVFGLFWPIFNSFSGGNIRNVDITPRKRIKNWLKRTEKSTETELMTGPKEKLRKLVEECGWEKEALLIGEDKTFIATEIPIALQQAQAFSCKEKSAILVGDAAATASFFQGMGANTALKTAEAAGLFFKNIQKQDPAAYQKFDQSLEEITNTLIEDSAFLFPNTAVHSN